MKLQKATQIRMKSLFPLSNLIFTMFLLMGSQSHVNGQVDTNDIQFLSKDIWHNDFLKHGEKVTIGDVNGDNMDDIIAFTGGQEGDVFVSLSEGNRFKNGRQKWHDLFCFFDRQPLVGDINGDGKDDIVCINGDEGGGIFVALSDGNSFQGTNLKWLEYNRSVFNDYISIGDVNGDGKEDLIAFVRSNGDVYVALSAGDKFESPQRWHSDFALEGEYPIVGDINGDRRCDIISYNGCDPIKASLSAGEIFDPRINFWFQDFCSRAEGCREGGFPYLLDLNGDRKDDVLSSWGEGDPGVNFKRCMFLGLSDGESFQQNLKNDLSIDFETFSKPDDQNLLFTGFWGDVNGDGLDDVVSFNKFRNGTSGICVSCVNVYLNTSQIVSSIKLPYEEDYEISLFPNPSRHEQEITLTYNLQNGGMIDIKLYDFLGKELYRMWDNEFHAAGKYTLTLPIAIPAGNYFLTFSFNNFLEVRKISIY